jgi:hypothetical protein
MAIGDLKDILHKIKAKLYPNYLTHADGAYLAHVDNEATLNIEDICTTLKNRGGYGGKFEDLVNLVHQFLNELVYQLCDGYAINLGYFSIHPHIGGAFDSEKEAHDHKKHPITFRFRSRKTLRQLAEKIAVEILGFADVQGYIGEYIDVEEEATNTIFVPGNQFVIHGNKIKVAGNDLSCGVYMVPVDAPASAVKLTRIAENSPNKVIGILHQSTRHSQNKIEIRTQFSGSSNTLLKTPRIITGGFVLEEA